MAFRISTWGLWSSGSATAATQRKMYSYSKFNETIAEISASGYFDDVLVNGNGEIIHEGDVICVEGSDGVALRYVTAIAPNITVAALEA